MKMTAKFGKNDEGTEVIVCGQCSALVVLGDDPTKAEENLIRHSQFHGVVEDLVEFVGLPPDDTVWVAEEDPHGWDAFWQLYADGRWEPDTHRLITETLQHGDLFVDIGAWIGPTALWAAETGAHVIAVEPDPVALSALRNIGHGIEVWPGALSVDGGPVRLAPNPKLGGEFGDSMSRLGDVASSIDVESWTLSTILAGRVPKMVKIDVEGYEPELVPAIVELLVPTRCVMQISCHGQILDRSLFDAWSDVTIPDDAWGDVVVKP